MDWNYDIRPSMIHSSIAHQSCPEDSKMKPLNDNIRQTFDLLCAICADFAETA